MVLAAAKEKGGRELGTPQTPAGGLRPPAPPAQQVRTVLMPPAAASGKERRELGTPQTPAGGLRPPAPPAQQIHSTHGGGEREGGKGSGAPSHCPPDSVPQTPAGGLRPPALPAQQLRTI